MNVQRSHLLPVGNESKKDVTTSVSSAARKYVFRRFSRWAGLGERYLEIVERRENS